MLSILQRRLQQELMDRPGLDYRSHSQALSAIARLNRFSRSSALIWRPIRRLAGRLDGSVVRVLDLACGGGDVAIALARRAAAAGVMLHVTGCDVSPNAVRYARRQAAESGVANVRFEQRDVLQGPLPTGYDVLTCTLFLHHLGESAAGHLLARMAKAARRLVLVSDLRRSRAGYALAWLATRLLVRSPVVRVDALLSVSAAFTVQELRALARRSGLAGAHVCRRWPLRLLLQWPPDQSLGS